MARQSARGHRVGVGVDGARGRAADGARVGAQELLGYARLGPQVLQPPLIMDSQVSTQPGGLPPQVHHHGRRSARALE